MHFLCAACCWALLPARLSARAWPTLTEHLLLPCAQPAAGFAASAAANEDDDLYS